MRGNLTFLAITLCISYSFSQDILVFQPDSTSGKDAKLHSTIDYMTSGKTAEMPVCAWTWSGKQGVTRELLQFDLSCIKKENHINKAILYLYGDIDFSSENSSTLSGSNEMHIQRVIEPWEEHSVTWANQPKSTTKNQVTTEATTNKFDNFKFDVTNMVQDMIDSVNYGFLFKLVTEEHYRCVNFASSDNKDSTRHPRLEVYIQDFVKYDTITIENKITTNDTIFHIDSLTILDTITIMDTLVYNDTLIINDTIVINDTVMIYDTSSMIDDVLVIRPNASIGKDARIHSSIDKQNSGRTPEMPTSAWTWNGIEGITRNLIQFDLSFLDKETIIDKAELCLYGDIDLSSENHSTLSGSNEMFIQRVIENWNEDSVNWQNQPKTTTQNQVITKATTSKFQNFNIDVTSMIQDMIDSVNYGFMFKLVTEKKYRCVNFASSDNADASRHPKLKLIFDHASKYDTIVIIDTITINTYDTVVTYDSITVTDTLKIDVTITSNQGDIQNSIKVYPNPAKDFVLIDNGNYNVMNNYKIKIVDLSGNIVFESKMNQQSFEINVNSFGQTGLYLILLTDKDDNLIEKRKLVLE